MNRLCYHIIRKITLILCIMCVHAFAFAEITPHTLTSTFDKKDEIYFEAVSYVGILLDPQDDLEIDSVIAKKDSFVYYQIDSLNKEKNSLDSPFWLHFSLINETDTITEWILDLQRQYSYQVHIENEGIVTYGGEVREHNNYKDRPYKPSCNTFPFKLLSGDSIELYLKFRAWRTQDFYINTKTRRDKNREIFELNYSLLGGKFQFVFVVLGFFLALFTFSQYLLYQDKAYLYYAIYLLIGSLYFLHRFELDFGYNILFADVMIYYSKFEPFLTYGLILSYGLFGQAFGNFKGKAKIKVDKCVKWLVIAVCAALVIHVLMIIFSYKPAYHVNRWMKVILLIFMITEAVVFYHNRNRLVNVFLIGSFILTLGTIAAFFNQILIENVSFLNNWNYDSYEVMRVVGFFEFFFFSIALGYKTRLIQDERNKMELELAEQELELIVKDLKVIKAQLNPHFIFNCLNSIKGLIRKNDNNTAEKYVQHFSKLARNTLNFSEKEYITLDEELEISDLYLKMEALRFGHSFEYKTIVDEGINLESIHIPPLILQPYLENAIHHGLHPKVGKKRLHIEVYREVDKLICAIDDTGIGRKLAAERKAKRFNPNPSFGMKLTQSRMMQYSKLAGEDIFTVNIIDKKNEQGQATGTRIEITFTEQ